LRIARARAARPWAADTDVGYASNAAAIVGTTYYYSDALKKYIRTVKRLDRLVDGNPATAPDFSGMRESGTAAPRPAQWRGEASQLHHGTVASGPEKFAHVKNRRPRELCSSEGGRALHAR
jgi:hypothetical protein